MKTNKHFYIIFLFSFFLLSGITYNYAIVINNFERVPNSEFFNFDKVLHYIKHNSFVYILLCLGIITYKLTTVINIIVNGFMLGMYLISMIQFGGGAFLIHGLPELIALYIGAYIGFSDIEEIISDKIKFITYFVLGEFLIILAAFLETYCTPIFF